MQNDRAASFRSTHAAGFKAGFSFLYTRADKRVNTPILRNLSNPRRLHLLSSSSRHDAMSYAIA